MTKPNLGCSHKKVHIRSAQSVRWKGSAPRNSHELKNAKIFCSFTNTAFHEWNKKVFPFFF